MTAVRLTRDYTPADVSPEKCYPQNFTSADNEMSPQYVLAPGQKLNTYTAPEGGRLGPLVWKLTPFLFSTMDGTMLANGTDSLHARGSNLSAQELPYQLALRPFHEFEPADGHIENVTEQTTQAPTNVAVVLPAPTELAYDISSYLAPTSPVSSVTSTMALTTPVASIASSATAAPPAVSGNMHQGLSNGAIAGAVIGSVVALTLVGALSRVAYKKIQSLRENAKMGERMKQWAASRGIEFADLPAATTQGDV